MYGPVSKYIKAVESNKLKNPQTKSYDTVWEWVHDPLALVKMYVFNYIATPLEKFLAQYQTDQPMIMFIAQDLEQLLVYG